MTRKATSIAAVTCAELDGVAALIDDGDLKALEIAFWEPILAKARIAREMVEHLSGDRIIRWFMTCHYLIATQAALVGDDVQSWVEDFVAAPVLGHGGELAS